MTGLLLAAALIPAPPAPPPYWELRGCDRGHPSQQARNEIRTMLLNHRPFPDWRKARRLAVCVATRRKARAGLKVMRKARLWRLEYLHRWPIAFHRLPATDQQWAWNTGACESGNNPSTNTGNGFYGAFQFVMSTWYSAGGSGSPTQHSWHYQAVIAVRWMHKAGAGQWPVCG